MNDSDGDIKKGFLEEVALKGDILKGWEQGRDCSPSLKSHGRGEPLTTEPPGKPIMLVE